MAQLVTYLFFNGRCREAMEFYKANLGGELKMMTVGESPNAAQAPVSKDKIMHSVLRADGIVLMASDMMGQGAVKGNAVSLCLICSSKKEIETLFSRLSKGGKVAQPLKEEFFGIFGSLTDRYGVDWMLQYDSKNMSF